MKKWLLLMAVVFPLGAEAVPRLGYATFGVMLHWNFSENEFKAFSYGLEAAYWTFEKEVEADGFLNVSPKIEKGGYGLDFGIEADRNSVRVYSEPQVGWVLAGVSCGPVLEIPKSEGPARLGVQGSGWVNMLAGVDFRYRRMDGKNHQAVGLSGKLPVLVSGGHEN